MKDEIRRRNSEVVNQRSAHAIMCNAHGPLFQSDCRPIIRSNFQFLCIKSDDKSRVESFFHTIGIVKANLNNFIQLQKLKFNVLWAASRLWSLAWALVCGLFGERKLKIRYNASLRLSQNRNLKRRNWKVPKQRDEWEREKFQQQHPIHSLSC